MADVIAAVKRCSRCKQPQALDCFQKDRSTKDGWCSICKTCKKARMSAYRSRPDAVLKAKASKAQYYLDNKERILQHTSVYALKHPEVYRQANREWRGRNPGVMSLYNRERRAREAAAPCIPFTLKQLAQRLSMFPVCYICGGEVQAIDHVKPLSRGGWHCLSNLRGICSPCNSKKKNKWPFAEALVIRGWSHSA